MRKKVWQWVGAVLVLALGVGAAVAVGAAGDDNIKACVVKATGQIQDRPANGKCGRAELAITISGNAFKKSRKGGTLTINGVAFKTGTLPKSLTINGTAFKTGTLPKSLTINGTAFRTGTLPNSLTINGNSFRTGTLPNSLTINGNSFRTGTLPNSLTINGNSFRTGTGGTLTINGTAFKSGAAGQPGPPGPPGAYPLGAAPSTPPDLVTVTAGESKPLTSATVRYSGAAGHRLLVTGGFNTVCKPSCTRTTPGWAVGFPGAAPLLMRQTSPMAGTDSAGASFSEIVVTPAVCAPCTFDLSLSLPSEGSGSPTSTVEASGIRFGVVDLGRVAP